MVLSGESPATEIYIFEFCIFSMLVLQFSNSFFVSLLVLVSSVLLYAIVIFKFVLSSLISFYNLIIHLGLFHCLCSRVFFSLSSNVILVLHTTVTVHRRSDFSVQVYDLHSISLAFIISVIFGILGLLSTG